MSVKPFAEHGHYTAVHDAVFDVVMPYCPPNAFKVLMFVLRKTRGWKKESDVLRYAEIKAGTGIKSDATLAKELDWLLKKRLLTARDEDGREHRKGSRKAPAYALNADFELRVETPETEAGEPAATPVSEATTTSVSKASNKQSKQEPGTSKRSNDLLSGEPQKAASPRKAPPKQKPMSTKQYGVARLVEARNAEKEAGGKNPLPLDEPFKRRFGDVYAAHLADGYEADDLEPAIALMVECACGEGPENLTYGRGKARWPWLPDAIAHLRDTGQPVSLDDRRQTREERERLEADRRDRERQFAELMGWNS